MKNSLLKEYLKKILKESFSIEDGIVLVDWLYEQGFEFDSDNHSVMIREMGKSSIVVYLGFDINDKKIQLDYVIDIFLDTIRPSGRLNQIGWATINHNEGAQVIFQKVKKTIKNFEEKLKQIEESKSKKKKRKKKPKYWNIGGPMGTLSGFGGD